MNAVRSALAYVAIACMALTPPIPAQATLASRVASAQKHDPRATALISDLVLK